GRRWRCCGRLPPHRAQPPPPCAPGRRTSTPKTWPRPTGLAAPPCSTCPTRKPATQLIPPRAQAAMLRKAAARTAGRGSAWRAALAATDSLPKGINPHTYFQDVLNHDMPWTPTRHEQREGRVDRFGQRAHVVRAVTLYGTDNGIDGIVLDVLLRKHEQIRKAL